MDAGRQFRLVGRADDEIRANPALAKEGVAADLAVLVCFFDLAQDVGDFAFRRPAADRFRLQGRAAFERPGQRVEHTGRDVRDARHQVDIAAFDPRRAGHAVGNKVRSLRNARHAQPRLGQPAGLVGVITFEDRARFGMDDDGHAQSLGHGVHGDVVMRRPDTAGGEEIIVTFAQRVHRFHDTRHHIGDDSHFGQANTLHLQPAGDLGNILVMRAPGQDLVPDHEEPGGVDAV